MKYFEFRQENAGGFYELNENLGHVVLIEAACEEDAIAKAQEIGIDVDLYETRWYSGTIITIPQEIITDIKEDRCNDFETKLSAYGIEYDLISYENKKFIFKLILKSIEDLIRLDMFYPGEKIVVYNNKYSGKPAIYYSSACSKQFFYIPMP